MRAKNAVLEMTPGKECLSFPGPGGYTIDWSPGTMHCRLEQAPSGHLILPCGEFHKLIERAGGLAPRSTTFHATPKEAFPPRTYDFSPQRPAPARQTVAPGRVGTGPAPSPPQTTN